LSMDGTSVEMVGFVKKEYAHLINVSTKFWFQGLADVGMKGGRLDVKLAPIIPYLVFGGITFETKFDKPYPKASANYFYRVYGNQYEAESKKIGKKLRENHLFRFQFRGRISGLKKGASIQYQGFEIGEVTDIELRYNSHNHMMEGTIQGDIDVSIFVDGNRSGFENLAMAVEDGLRAQLSSVNPLINSLYIDLIFSKNAAPVTLIANETEGTLFPVMDSQKSSLLDELTRFTNKLNKLEIAELLNSTRRLIDESTQPLHDALVHLNEAIVSLNTLTQNNTEPLKKMLESFTKSSDALGGLMENNQTKAMPVKLNAMIKTLDETLASTKKVLRGYRSNSLFGKRVTQMLKEINKSSEETKRLLRKLNKKPDSLLFGE